MQTTKTNATPAKETGTKKSAKAAISSKPVSAPHVNPSKAKSGAGKPVSHKFEYRREQEKQKPASK